MVIPANIQHHGSSSVDINHVRPASMQPGLPTISKLGLD